MEQVKFLDQITEEDENQLLDLAGIYGETYLIKYLKESLDRKMQLMNFQAAD